MKPDVSEIFQIADLLQREAEIVVLTVNCASRAPLFTHPQVRAAVLTVFHMCCVFQE